MTHDCYDPYLTIEISLPRGKYASPIAARVTRRATDENDQPIGTSRTNPLIDFRRYDVQFVDGYSETLSANILAENLIAQVDQEGHRQRMLSEISDHRSNDRAIKIEDGTFTTSRGLKKIRRTTTGWELYVKWKDGGGNWIELKDLNHTYPVELAE